MDNIQLQEELLDAWLKLSSAIANERLVSGFSFNEAFVLNLLYKNYTSDVETKMTAKDLCKSTNILKSQMNSILTALENKGMIVRERSKVDKRLVEISLNSENIQKYIESHQQVLHITDGIVSKLTNSEVNDIITSLNKLAETFNQVMEEEHVN